MSEQLTALPWRTMRTSDQLDALLPALIAAHAGFTPIVRDRKVEAGARRYSYYDLAGLLEATTPALLEAGLVIVQSIHVEPDSGGWYLLSRLLHTSGQWIESEYPLSGQTAQEQGSAITYARRYSLSALLGVAGEDDDGAAASAASAPSAAARRMASRRTRPQESQAGGADEITVPGKGRDAGKPFSQLSEASLKWWAENASTAIYRDEAKRVLAALQANRQPDPEPGADDAPPIDDGDLDIPF